MADDLFLDTSFAIALASKKDVLHPRAKSFAQTMRSDNRRLITSRAILFEIGNSLAKSKTREFCVRFLDDLESDPRTTIVSLSDELYDKALGLFRARQDKEWGLVDCLSFVIMEQFGVTDALTADEHFIQAGFRALLREQ